MGYKANPKIQEFFLWLLYKDRVSVYDDGTVINNITGTEYNATDSSGYKKISYSYKKKIWQIQAHRLVWIAFNGPIEDDSLVINHINGVKSDNRLVNLELVSCRENTIHAMTTGLLSHINYNGELSSNSKLTNLQAVQIRKDFVSSKFSVKQLAANYMVHRMTIYYVLRGKTYKKCDSSLVYKAQCLLDINNRARKK